MFRKFKSGLQFETFLIFCTFFFLHFFCIFKKKFKKNTRVFVSICPQFRQIFQKMSQQESAKWWQTKSPDDVVFPTNECNSTCTGTFGFCTNHEVAQKNRHGDIVLGGYHGGRHDDGRHDDGRHDDGRHDGRHMGHVVVVCNFGNTHAGLSMWSNGEGVTLRRGDNVLSAAMGYHDTAHKHAHALEAGNYRGGIMFGHRVNAYLAGYGGAPWRY